MIFVFNKIASMIELLTISVAFNVRVIIVQGSRGDGGVVGVTWLVISMRLCQVRLCLTLIAL